MKRVVFYIFLFVFVAWSQVIYAQVYHIGDLVTNEDGSQGLVFYVNPDGSGGWMVALTDASTDCIWGNNTPSGLDFHPVQEYLLTSALDGYANTQTLRQSANPNDFPAAQTVDFDHGWYLPSIGQLIHINSVLGLLDERFSIYGGQTLNGKYWSSTELDMGKVWCIDASLEESFNQGGAFPENKIPQNLYKYGVRAVHDFSCREIVYDTTLLYSWNTGSSDPYLIVTPAQTTTYSVTATSGYGCSNSAEQIVIVQQDSSQTIYDTICQGENYVAYGFHIGASELQSAGSHTFDRIIYAGVCQTEIALQLQVNAVDTFFVDTMICEGSVLVYNDHTYSETGSYYQTFTSANGCDSLIVIRLSVHPNIEITTEPLTVCPMDGQLVLSAQFENVSRPNRVEWTFNGSTIVHGNRIDEDSCNFTVPVRCDVELPYTVTVSDDVCYNTSTNTVHIIDTLPPIVEGVLDTLFVDGCSRNDAPAVVRTAAALEQMGVSITDDCTPDSYLQVSCTESVRGTCPIVITRTYMVLDVCYNHSRIVQTIVINRPDSFQFSAAETSRVIQCIDEMSVDDVRLPEVTDFCGTRLDPTGPVIDSSAFNGCEGDVTSVWTYVDCANHSHDWTFTYHIQPEDFTIAEQDGEATVTCLSAMVMPTPPVVTSACGDTLTPTGPQIDSSAFNGCEGDIEFSWAYADCANHLHAWTFTYRIQLEDFTIAEQDGEATVPCLSAIATPTPPVVMSACGDMLTPSGPQIDSSAFNGCEGDVGYTWVYTDCANHSHAWTFTYYIQPEDFTIAEQDGEETMACLSAMMIPTPPVVTSACGDTLSPVGPQIDSSAFNGCEGDIVYAWTYADCANHSHDWTFTCHVQVPSQSLSSPEDGQTSVPCIEDVVRPSAPTIQDVCGRQVLPVFQDSVTTLNADGTGTVVFTFSYTDCSGQEVFWHYTCRIIPNAFTPRENVEDTVHCLSEVVEPETPIVSICGQNIELALLEQNGQIADGCGDSVFVYQYTVYDSVYQWIYTYHIVPEDFTIMEPDGMDTLGCPSAIETPTPPVVTSACGDILVPVGPQIDSSTFNGCEGQIEYTWTYSDCAGHTHDWTFTHNIQLEDFAITSPDGTDTLSCPSEVETPTPPEVVSACGEILVPEGPQIDSSAFNGCEGEIEYTWTYRDCAGHTHDWTFTHYVLLEDFAITDSDGADTVGCPSAVETPTPPIVPSACGDILVPEGPRIDSSAFNGCEGEIEYAWTYRDCAGHTHDWTFTYRIERLGAPEVLAEGVDSILFVECFADVQGPQVIPFALSSCEDTITGTLLNVEDDFDGCTGMRIYTYQYRDCADEVSLWHFTCVIADTIAPEFIVPADFDVYRNGSNHYSADTSITGAPTAISDNCSSIQNIEVTCLDSVVTSHIFTMDTIVRVWSVADACHNHTVQIQRIFIHPVNHDEMEQTLCEEDLPLIWNGIELFSDKDTTITLQNEELRDSLVTIHFRVLYGTFQSFTESACTNYGWHDSLYTQSGIYTYEYRNGQGCVSVDTLKLTVNYEVSSSDTTFICENMLPQTLDGHLILAGADSEVVFIDTLRAVTNCDSIVTRYYRMVPAPDLHILDYHIDCSDTLVTLEAVTDAAQIHWSTGAVTQQVTVESPGSYSVQAVSDYGCVATDSIDLYWHEHPVLAFNIPDLCAGGTYDFNIDYGEQASIVLQSNASTLAVNDTIFLPDGTDCDPYGCSYRSPVTFTDFSPNARINSVDDIYYLRLNMEHSFSGDIYINLTCPNGQKADILKFGGFANSSCAYNIPQSSRGWASGTTVSGEADFGVPNENDYSNNRCDRIRNPYGSGWNYCWSNNTDQNYTYASGTGSLIYRPANVHNGRIDSSNVAQHTQFYHPDQSFSSLVGCPMNGDWYIEVIDGYSRDNGYIFGWELALTPELLSQNLFRLDSFVVDGPWVSTADHSTFTIAPPDTLQNDTVVTYVITLYDDSLGCAFDTTINVNIWVPRDTLLEARICAGDLYDAYGFHFQTDANTRDTILIRHIETVHGCDSTIFVQLTVLPTYHHFDTIAIPSNQLPYTYRGTVIPAGRVLPVNVDTIYNSIDFCDSTITTTVLILQNDTVRLDSIVCSTEIPFIWNGVTFWNDSAAAVNIPQSSGTDSVVVMTVHVVPNPIVSVNVADALCAGDTMVVSIGYQDDDDIVLLHSESTHFETQKIFLPDGMSCQPYGTYYRSYAHFTDFIDGATLPTQDDILYLRLKLEHSAIEDLRIHLVCPNGQSCKIVPDEDYDGWGTVPHNYFRINLGLANRMVGQLSCDSTLNPIGEPWNYVWSNNMTQGYQYAGGTFGYCYEPTNIHLQDNPYWDNSNGLGLRSYVIDSSNVANMSQIYHPLQSFNSLVGCPLNGDWYIQIQDLQEEDNGYLVEWELALSPDLLRRTNSHISSISLNGLWAENTSGGHYQITPPADLTHDTVVTYLVSVADSMGCIYDTTFDVHFYVGSDVTIYDTIFRYELPYTFNGCTFPVGTGEDTTVLFNYTNIHGCDSTVTYHLHIFTCDTVRQYLHLCESDLPYTWDGIVFAEADTLSVNHPNTFGCDTTFIYYLTITSLPVLVTSADEIIHNGESATLTASGALSYTWSPAAGLNTTSGNTVVATPTQSQYYYVTATNATPDLIADGFSCQVTDSVLVLVYRDLDSTICENNLPFVWNDMTFTEEGVLETIIENPNGIDDAIRMHLYVNHNSYYDVNVEITENELPYTFLNATFQSDTAGVIFTLENAAGCDSVITFSLVVHRNSQMETDTTLCDYELPLLWQSQTLFFEGTYTETMQDMYGADSVAIIHLRVIHTNLEIISNTEDFCEENHAVLEVITSMPNFEWNTGDITNTIEVTASGNYSVTATEEHCVAETHYTVESCEFEIFLPNAITSGYHDGLNDYFSIHEAYYPQISDQNFSVVIANRWGEVVFASKDKRFRWNGEVKGTIYTNVIYNYVIRYRTLNGDAKIIKGSITVL